jgi:hypothetical protein
MLRSRDISPRHGSKPLHHRLNLKGNGTGSRYLSEVLGEIATFDAPCLVFGRWHALTFISVLFGISCRIILLLCPKFYLLLYLSLPCRNESHAYILRLNHLSHQKANHFRSAQNHRHPSAYTAYTLSSKPSLSFLNSMSPEAKGSNLMCLGSSADSPAIRFRIPLPIISQYHPLPLILALSVSKTLLIFGTITLAIVGKSKLPVISAT